MTNDFPHHQPGDWYSLSRKQFIVFAGLAPMYIGFLAELQSSVHRGFNGDWPDPERQAFWAAIAAAEAMRKFLPRDEQEYCTSFLHMQSSNGSMEWDYLTWSNTRFKAVEERQLYRENNEENPQPMNSRFLVQIPPDRDLPGGHHHTCLRSGVAYNT